MNMDVLSSGWRNSLLLEQKVASITSQQARYGWLFDKPKANILIEGLTSSLETIDDELAPLMPPRRLKLTSATVDAPFTKKGDIAKRVVQWYGDMVDRVAGPFSKVDWEPFNLNSDKQLKEFLLGIGWEPDTWNYNDDFERTSPKLTESSLLRVEHPLGRHIARRAVLTHRLGLITGLVENVRSDGRIPSQVNPLGAGTHRATHRIVVNLPKAGYKDNGEELAYLGNDIRSLFIVPDWCNQVGCDAKGLQLRCLAHYINDPEFTDIIINGDIHSVNLDTLVGICPTRRAAKNIIYALIFGAANPKLATTALHSGNQRHLESVGNEIRSRLLNRFKGFQELAEGVKYAAQSRGYLYGLDGRKVYVRQPHKALNTLLQNMESVVMKVAMCYLYDLKVDSGIHAEQLTWQHDEFQYEVEESRTDELVDYCYQCIPMAGEFLSSNCPLANDVKVGKNWQQTH